MAGQQPAAQKLEDRPNPKHLVVDRSDLLAQLGQGRGKDCQTALSQLRRRPLGDQNRFQKAQVVPAAVAGVVQEKPLGGGKVVQPADKPAILSGSVGRLNLRCGIGRLGRGNRNDRRGLRAGGHPQLAQIHNAKERQLGELLSLGVASKADQLHAPRVGRAAVGGDNRPRFSSGGNRLGGAKRRGQGEQQAKGQRT